MKYYLVKETKIFIDPHSSPDEGGVEKYVIDEETYEEEYKELNGKYGRDGEVIENLQGSEDGYNSQCEFYTIKEISEEKYLEYKEIIEKYNKIW